MIELFKRLPLRGFMSKIDDYELNIRRKKLLSQYQQYQSTIDNLNNGNVDKNNHMSSVNAHIMGRSVAQIDGSASKEARLFQNHVNSTKEDSILQNYVNSAKKIESHQKL